MRVIFDLYLTEAEFKFVEEATAGGSHGSAERP